MDNNDRLIRLRYALDLRDTQMIEIFKLGGIDVSQEELRKLLIKSKDENDVMKYVEESNTPCDNYTLESFLNGLIIFKRGKQEVREGQQAPPTHIITNNKSVNNIFLKKLKIALALTSEDILDILQAGGVVISKGELSAVLRKEGHKNYKDCGDRYIRNFLKGLAIKNR
ncbi:MAG: DUF1456 family protein [Cellulosilyticaceae bacterium]